MPANLISDSDLGQLEDDILKALETRSTEHLDVLGFGETGVALAWPSTDPTLVVKRVTSEADPVDANIIKEGLEAYIADLGEYVTVAPTDVRVILNAQDRLAIYLVQPLFAKDKLVETILATAEPAEGNSIIDALTSLILQSTEGGRIAVDAQFSNFAWVDEQLVLFDVGTPLMFNVDGSYTHDTKYVRRAMPALLGPLTQRKYTEVITDIGSRRGCFQQATMSLVRQGQEQWLKPALAAFNPHLDLPMTASDVTDRAKFMHRQSRGLKRLMQVERAWSTKLRRRPYDLFITDSFTGELL